MASCDSPSLSAERPDLRTIGFSIIESLGFLIAKPTDLQKMGYEIDQPLPCQLDWDYDEAVRLPGPSKIYTLA